MKKKLYFMLENATDLKKKALGKKIGAHSLYGGIGLEKKSQAKIIDVNIKNILKLKAGSIVVINRTKYIPLLRLFGKKVVLISINSNHDLTQNKKTLKGAFLYLLYKIHYNLCNLVICISDIQTEKLKEIGVKNLCVIPLGVEKSWLNRTLSKEFYLSAGGDKGKNHDFVARALKGSKVKILEENFLPYHKYIDILAKAKALVLNVDTNKKGSSDLSGTTTCFEALLMKKPIFINYQPWLKELFKENYYVYKNKEELRKLLKKNIKFKEIDYGFLTLDHFTYKLLENIEKI